MAEHDTSRRTEGRQQQALGEELRISRALPAPTAARIVDLPLARDAAREQQAAEVGAGHGEDQQHQRADQAEIGLTARSVVRRSLSRAAVRSGVAAWRAGDALVFPDVGRMLGRNSPRATGAPSSTTAGVTPGRIRPHIFTPLSRPEVGQQLAALDEVAGGR